MDGSWWSLNGLIPGAWGNAARSLLPRLLRNGHSVPLSKTGRTFLIHNRSIIADAYIKTLLNEGHRVVVIESDADRGAPYVKRAELDPRAEVVQLAKDGERIPSIAKAWIDPNRILDIVERNNVTDIVVGYGFFSENPEFAGYCRDLECTFHGPSPEVLELLGSKYHSKVAGVEAGMQVAPFSDLIAIQHMDPPEGAPAEWAAERKAGAWKKMRVGVGQAGGYPVMLKANYGGGGRGQQRCGNEAELKHAFETVPPQAKKFFGSPDIFLEKYIEAAPGASIHHIEVQFARDRAGDTWFSPRECSLQMNRQKVFEMTADFVRLLRSKWKAESLNEGQMKERAHRLESDIFQQCERLINRLGYVGIGTAEFLFDTKSETFRFMEVNPRIQVEHGVTEEAESTPDARLDLKLLQLRLTDGGLIREHKACRPQLDFRKANDGKFPPSNRKFAIEARINAVNMATRAAAAGLVEFFHVPEGSGVRLDTGVNEKTRITDQVDPHVANVIATATTFEEAHRRLLRALERTQLIGVTSNLDFLCRTLKEPDVIRGEYNIGYLDTHQRRLGQAENLDGLARYVAFRTVNPEGRRLEKNAHVQQYFLSKPVFDSDEQDALIKLAQPQKSAYLHAWAEHYKANNQHGELPVAITETALRDGQQSEYAARFLASTLLGAIPHYRRLVDRDPAKTGLISGEFWGGAIFDTLMRFGHMNPYDLLKIYATLLPDVPIQALFRGSNVLGYSSQPDNVVRETVRLAAKNGLDKVRVFDSLNNPLNAAVCIQAAVDFGMYVSGAICYLDKESLKEPIQYFVDKAREYAALGCHQIDIKDMAGVGKAEHVAEIIKAIKRATGLPVAYHTHDTSTWAAATIHEAIKAGVDVVDLAVDSMANGSSQPALGAALRFEKETGRIPPLLEIRTSKADDTPLVDTLSEYFNADLDEYASRYWDPAGRIKSLVAELGMPGGQISNLIAQAKAAGLTTESEFKNLIADAQTAGLASYNDLKAVFARYKEIGTFIGGKFDTVIDVQIVTRVARPPLVTPSSKGVGDEAITAVLSAKKIERPEISYAELLGDKSLSYVPSESFKQLIRGDMGLPPKEHTFSPEAAKLVLLRTEKDARNIAEENERHPGKFDECGRLTNRPGAFLADIDIGAKKLEAEKLARRPVTEEEANIFILFESVFRSYDTNLAQHGEWTPYLPPAVFFGGLMAEKQSVSVNFQKYRLAPNGENGPAMILAEKVHAGDIELAQVGDVKHGYKTVKLLVNGEDRFYTVPDLQWMKANRPAIPMEELQYSPNTQKFIASGMEGVLSTIAKHGQKVKKGDIIAVIEAMKMQVDVPATCDGYINRLTESKRGKQEVLYPGAPVGDGSVLLLVQERPPSPLKAGFENDEPAAGSNVVNLTERRAARNLPPIPQAGNDAARNGSTRHAARLAR